MSRIATKLSDAVSLESEKLSDDSEVHNVLYTTGHGTLRLSCEDEDHAGDLGELLCRVVGLEYVS